MTAEPTEVEKKPLFDLDDLSAVLRVLVTNEATRFSESKKYREHLNNASIAGNIYQGPSIFNSSRALASTDTIYPTHPQRKPERLAYPIDVIHGTFREIGKRVGEWMDEDELPEVIKNAIRTYDLYVEQYRERVRSYLKKYPNAKNYASVCKKPRGPEDVKIEDFTEAIATLELRFPQQAQIPLTNGNWLNLNQKHPNLNYCLPLFLFAVGRSAQAQINDRYVPPEAENFLMLHGAVASETAQRIIHLSRTFPDIEAIIRNVLNTKEQDIFEALQERRQLMQTFCLSRVLSTAKTFKTDPIIRVVRILGDQLFPEALETPPEVGAILEGLATNQSLSKGKYRFNVCRDIWSSGRAHDANGQVKPSFAQKLSTSLSEAEEIAAQTGNEAITYAVKLLRNCPLLALPAEQNQAMDMDTTPENNLKAPTDTPLADSDALFACIATPPSLSGSGGYASGPAPAPARASHRR